MGPDPSGHQYEKERYEEEETRIDRDYANGEMTKEEYEAETRALEARRQLDPAMQPTGLDYDHWDAMADAAAAATVAGLGTTPLRSSPISDLDTPKNTAVLTPTKAPPTRPQSVAAGAAVKKVTISASRFPEAAAHIRKAQATGQPTRVTIDRKKAVENRRASLKGTKTQSGKDRDEYPPASTREGGAGASTENITSSDNRGAGASYGNQIRGLPDGTEIDIVVGP